MKRKRKDRDEIHEPRSSKQEKGRGNKEKEGREEADERRMGKVNEVRQYSWLVHDKFTSSNADESGRGREGERNERGVKRGEVRKVPSFYIEQVLPRKGWKEEER